MTCVGPGDRVSGVTLTALAVWELSQVRVPRRCCRRTEVSVSLRFAGGLGVSGGQVVVEARLGTGEAARRLGRDIAEVFGHRPEVIAPLPGREGWLVRVGRDGALLARVAGLVNRRGQAVRGLAPWAVSGAVCDAEAVWRAAFLSGGSLTASVRSGLLEVACPGPAAAVALAGAARRLGVAARVSDRSGVDQVLVRDDDAIAAVLTRMGAMEARRAWQEQRAHGRPRARPRSENFAQANLDRAAQAAVLACARLERALQILEDRAGGVPEHLLAAARLRLRHRQASWEELAQLADPPTSKNAIAGRVRRVLIMADQHAARLGIPDTTTLVPDLLDA
jgi:DNA-binding protein WhiA